jgi:tripartite-type tricarboxylate transporter receptor subunit TctC
MLIKLRMCAYVIASTITFITGFSSAANAQDYPTKPVTLVVGNIAGVNSDLIARIVAEGLSAELGQTVVVENKPGAGSYIALKQVKEANPDGYTLFVMQSAFAVGPFVQKDFDIDVANDFQHVAGLCAVRGMLFAGKAAPFRSFKEFVEYAKSHPGEVMFGSGTLSQKFDASVLFSDLGVHVVNNVYTGSASADQALLSGDIHLLSSGLTEAKKGMVASGLIVPVVYVATERNSVLPDVPLITEFAPERNASGFSTGFGISGPIGMPDAVLKRLNEAVASIFKQQAIRDKLVSNNCVEVFSDTSAEGWKKTMEASKERYTAASKLLNIEPQ